MNQRPRSACHLTATRPVNSVATASLLPRETIDNLEIFMAFEVKYGGAYLEFCLLECNIFQCVESQPIFGRNKSPPYLGSKNKPKTKVA
jgi:hypothetical protein